MLRTAAAKVMWVGRATVFLVGLAVILALTVGVVSKATAHTGSAGLFHLGHNNPVSALSTLTGTLAGSVLKVDNNGAGPALLLEVGSGKAPLTVNSTAGKATNLNADKVDGHDAPMWAVVNADGSIPLSSDAAITSFQTGLPGVKEIEFPRDVSKCAATATINKGFTGFISTNRVADPKRVRVHIGDDATSDFQDLPFELVVNC